MRPAIRRVAIATVILLLPIVGYTSWDAVERHRIGQAIAALRAAGAPLVLADLDLDGSRNDSLRNQAASYYKAASALAEAGPRVWDVKVQGADANRPGATESLRDALTGSLRDGIVTDARAHAMAEFVRNERDGLVLLDKAAALPFGGSHAALGHSPAAGLQAVFEAASVRTLYLAATNDAAGAVASLRAELGLVADRRSPLDDALGAIWHQRSIPVAHLQFLLEHTAASDADLEALDRALAPADDDEALTWYVVTLRALAVDADFSALRPSYGNASVFSSFDEGFTDPWHLPPSLIWIERPYVAHDLLNQLSGLARQVDASHGPWPDRIDAILKIEGQGELPVMTRTLAPMRAARLTAVAIDLAEARAARLAMAVERCRRQHGGALPRSISDVVPAFLASTPVDPFSGRPMVYRQTPSGYVVYSVGPDRRDDGGTLSGLEPLDGPGLSLGRDGLSPKTGDIGLRIGK